MELLVHLINGLQVIFLGGHNGFVIILCYLILEMLQLVYHRVQFWALYFSPYMLMTSHMLWYLVMFVSMHADDTLMFYCNSNHPTLEKKLQDDIDSIFTGWFPTSYGLTSYVNWFMLRYRPLAYGC